jgi:uncharacterized protein (DUF1499 family)
MAGFVQYFLSAIGVVVLLLAGAVVSGLYILPVGKVVPIDFPNLALTAKPNQYLVCPPDYCTAIAQHPSPKYDIPVAELQRQWQQYLASEPGLSLIQDHPDGQQVTYVARSNLIGYPDLITLRFIETGAQQSTLAIYSRSIYGYSDLGVNQNRIKEWVSSFSNQK